MTYSEIKPLVKEGKTAMLPHFIGYFIWNYAKDEMWFYNGAFNCPADQLNVKNRNDFYYII